MANYNRVLTWIPNDTINIPQFPDYLSGTNAGLGTDLIEAGAKFKTGPHPVAIGDVVMTYDVNNLPVEIVQIVEVVTDTLCTVSSAITAGLVYRIYRSNGGSPNIKQGYDGYNFRITAVVAPASNHDLNVIPAGQTTESLLSVTIFLPTRRACRSLCDSFLELTNGRPTFLPKMKPLGDIDDDDLSLSNTNAANVLSSLEIAPPISNLHRQLLLTQLIMARNDGATTYDQATWLAQELSKLIDQVKTQKLSFKRLKNLVKDSDLSDHWHQILEFLEIVTTSWPKILQERGVLDPSERRNLLLESQKKIWKNSPPRGPIIAAGSTGSIPATADLLKPLVN